MQELFQKDLRGFLTADPDESFPLPISGENPTVHTLDLRQLDKPRLEVKCDSRVWQVVLARKVSFLDVVLDCSGPSATLVLPNEASYRVRLAEPQVLIELADGPFPMQPGAGGFRSGERAKIHVDLLVRGKLKTLKLLSW